MNREPFSIHSERVRTLVLARLLPETKSPLSRAKALMPVARCTGLSKARIEEVLDQTIANGLIAQKPLRLTPEGREALRVALGVATLPEPKTWDEVRRQLLVDIALPRDKKGGKAADANQLAAAILVAHHGLPISIRTLRAAVDCLAWRALGVETEAPFDKSRVQRHLLRDIVAEDARVDFPTFRELVAMRATGAKRRGIEGFRQAVLAQWLEESQPRGNGAPKAPEVLRTANDNGGQERPALADLAAAVVRAAREPAVARFHDDRAFIGSIWEHMHGRPPVGSMPLAEFKEQLVAAHRAGLLRMTRADLAKTMDPSEVQRSEASYLGATFHFVALDAAGGR